ncbi:MAG: restriction endonuclease subunit S [Gammaproteobacteria bacterium]|nr:restriction endonuclease subunit S [Gammaproteobacteria bacterium]MBL7003242.1 restriction endonuclease subunit S [Gammaproteobacteria bacterium]
MKVKLHEIADIEAGHPFRGAIPEHDHGDCQVIQVRDIDTDGQVNWDGVIYTQITGRKRPDWLREGSIIFAARGARNMATCISNLDRQVVCAQHFFRITLKTADGILPEFIAWQLNQTSLQRYFRQSAEGSAQVSIRRAVLEQALVALPPLEQQIILMRFADKALKEKQLLTKLIDNRQQQIDAIANDLFK